MDVSKVLTELRKTGQLVAETIVSVRRLTDEREAQRWVATAMKTAVLTRATAKGE